MNRRGLLALIAVEVLTVGIGYSQQLGVKRRISVIQPQRETDKEAQAWVAAFLRQLDQLGWREGENLEVDYRWYGGDLALLESQASKLVSLQPDVIFCMSTPTVAALQRVTLSIPIVFVNANNPVGGGFVASLAHPGGNITGFVAFEPAMGGKWIEVLREIAPTVKRVGLLYNPKTHTGQYFQSAEAAASSLALTSVRLPFDGPAELERKIDNLAREPGAGLIVLPDSSTRVHRDLIVRLAGQHKLPAIYSYRLFTTAGGLAYYGTSTINQFRHAADYVDRILRGAGPGNLPVQAPTEFELVINLRTARSLELTIPPSLLARADEIIE